MDYAIKMKKLSVLLTVSMLAFISSLAMAEECDESNLDCLICSQLTDSEQYLQNNMKYMQNIVAGDNRWLFRSMVDLTNDFGMPANMQPEFKRMIQAFKENGTEIAIVIQPTRGLMHRDKVRFDGSAHGFNFIKASNSLNNFSQQMRSGGAIVPNVMTLINNPPDSEYFFRRDHHWTPAGAQATAKLAAMEIMKHPVYEKLTKSEFYTEPGVVLPKEGTLNLALARICGNNYGFQFVRGYRTLPKASANSLFDDEEPEVVLVGTSNAASRDNESKQFNFDGFLKEYLSVDILNHALPGAGPYGSLLDYLQSDAYLPENPPKLIIWELPANYSLESGLLYRELIPAIKRSCEKSSKNLTKTMLGPMTTGQRVEIFSNTGNERASIVNSRGFFEINLSDKDLKDFYIITYYDNGARDKVRYRREAIVKGGKYYLELSQNPEFKDANLMSVFFEATADINTPIELGIQLCR